MEPNRVRSGCLLMLCNDDDIFRCDDVKSYTVILYLYALEQLTRNITGISAALPHRLQLSAHLPQL